MRGEAALDRGGGESLEAPHDGALDARPRGTAAVSGLTGVSVFGTSTFIGPSGQGAARRPVEGRPRVDLAARVKSNTKTQRGTPRPLGLGRVHITGEYEKPNETAASSPRPVNRDTMPEIAAARLAQTPEPTRAFEPPTWEAIPRAPHARMSVPDVLIRRSDAADRPTERPLTVAMVGTLLVMVLSVIIALLIAGP